MTTCVFLRWLSSGGSRSRAAKGEEIVFRTLEVFSKVVSYITSQAGIVFVISAQDQVLRTGKI